MSAEDGHRMREAAHWAGCRPTLSQRSPHRFRRPSVTIGALFEDLSNPFAAALLGAVQDSARERGALVLAASDDDDSGRRAALLEALAVRHVDGLIAALSGTDQDRLHAEHERGLPMVLVDRPATLADTDCVRADDRASTARAVGALIARGHRRIAYLGDRETAGADSERRAGYEESLAASGIAVDPGLVRTDLRGSDLAAGATAELLRLTDPPTAIFAARDVVTIGAIQALRARRLHHSVALVGFDDFPLADLLEPAVSVIRQDLSEIGRAAASRLLARIDGDRAPSRTLIVPTTYLARGSGELPPP